MAAWRRPVGEEPAGPPASPEEQEKLAREVILTQLSMMARSREQLRAKVLDRGVSEEIADAVLARFEEVGLVDDAAFAESLVRMQRESRGLSRRGLRHELTKRGVDAETAAEAVDAIDDEAEYATALELARKKARSVARLERPVQERRIASMLGRKGYGASISYRAMREALAEIGSEMDAEDVGPLG